jgi:hypothetical protein
MKFSLVALFAACVAPATAEVYFKENFNDDVSLLASRGPKNDGENFIYYYF